MRTYVYVDASNLFYGGKKSLGWSIDHKKLLRYLKDRYQAFKVYYFGGVEIHDFTFDYLQYESVPIKEVEKYLIKYIKLKKKYLSEEKIILLNWNLKRIRFYLKIEKFGYKLVLKPVKTYEDEDGNAKRKANCDVDMAFYLMRDKDSFDRALILSGDGDFLPVLKYLRQNKKEVLVLARSPRTAKEIKKFAGDKFMDFEYLRERIKRTDLGD